MTPGVQLLAVRRCGGNGGSYQGALEELEGSWVEDQGFMLSLRSLWDIQGRKAGGSWLCMSGAGRCQGYSGTFLFICQPLGEVSMGQREGEPLGSPCLGDLEGWEVWILQH